MVLQKFNFTVVIYSEPSFPLYLNIIRLPESKRQSSNNRLQKYFVT